VIQQAEIKNFINKNLSIFIDFYQKMVGKATHKMMYKYKELKENISQELTL
jgi:hypothetical protein